MSYHNPISTVISLLTMQRWSCPFIKSQTENQDYISKPLPTQLRPFESWQGFLTGTKANLHPGWSPSPLLKNKVSINIWFDEWSHRRVRNTSVTEDAKCPAVILWLWQIIDFTLYNVTPCTAEPHECKLKADYTYDSSIPQWAIWHFNKGQQLL